MPARFGRRGWLALGAWMVGAVGVTLGAAGVQAAAHGAGPARAMALLIMGWGFLADWLVWARSGRLFGRNLGQVSIARRWLLLPHAPGQSSAAPLFQSAVAHCAALLAALGATDALGTRAGRDAAVVALPLALVVLLSADLAWRRRPGR